MKTDNGKTINFSKKDLPRITNKMKTNIHFFQQSMLKIKRKKFDLSDGQLNLMRQCKTEQFVIGVFNRQGGKSTTFGVLDVHDLYFEDDQEQYIYAPIKRQSNIIFGKVKGFITGNKILEAFVDKRAGWRKDYIQLANGNNITTMSASDQSHVRGDSPSKIQIDESQDISDYVYYEDILPGGATTGAKLQEAGTPKGRNHFYDTWEHEDDYKKILQTWTQCPFISVPYINMMKKKLPKKSFDQEFNCIWDETVGTAFSRFHIDRLFPFTVDNLGEKIPVGHEEETYDSNALYYAGVDIGKSPARTVLSILREKENGGFIQSYLREYHYDSYTDIISELQADLEDWDPVATAVDRTGVGDPIADMLYDMYDGVECVFYGPGIKQSLVDNFLVTVEAVNGIELIEDFDQKKQFRNWKKRKLSSGRYTYKKGKGELDDMVNANLLAVWVTEGNDGRLEVKHGKSSAASELNQRMRT